jgi:hypothetical protein
MRLNLSRYERNASASKAVTSALSARSRRPKLKTRRCSSESQNVKATKNVKIEFWPGPIAPANGGNGSV